jgi:signal transduction histidine kinase
LGYYYQETGKIDEAKIYFDRSLEHAKLSGNNQDEFIALESLIELKLNEKGQVFFERYKSIKQELESQNQQKIEDLYHLKYDTEKKNAEIQKQAYALKIAEEENLLEQNRTRYALMGFGLVLIAAVLAVLFLKSEITKQTLTSKLEKLEALYEDRNDISKHLHDEIASDIAVMTQKLDGQPEVKEHMHNVRIKIRDLSRNLNTTDFGDLVFSDMVKNLVVDLFGAKSKVHLYDLQIVDDLEIYPEGFKKAVYLIIKEALLNIEQHAKAQQITVQIEQEKEQFIVRVQDNGVGFDNNRTKRGIGLRNIKNRAEDLGGTFSVVSEVGVGTSLTCVCPLGKEQTIA